MNISSKATALIDPKIAMSASLGGDLDPDPLRGYTCSVLRSTATASRSAYEKASHVSAHICNIFGPVRQA